MSIESRIERLERFHRRWRLLACILSLALLGIIVMGVAGQGEIVSARMLLIHDDKGQNRVIINRGSIQLYDDAGRMRINIYEDQGQALIRLFDSGKREKIFMGVGPSGHSVMHYNRYHDGRKVEVFKNY